MSETGYATAAQLVSVLDSGLTAELQNASSDIDKAMLDASREIDSWLAGRYVVPVDTTACPLSAPILRSKCVTVAKYLIVDRKSSFAASHLDSARRLYDEAVAWGVSISKRVMSLPDATPVPIPDPAALADLAPNIRMGGDAPVFTEDTMGMF